ncbi:MAG: radical SAM family heme chaperone HemW [Candidatus Marinamargulisbacteria bacterium]
MTIKTPPIGLYIHVPFCIKLCPYCAFYKMPMDRDTAHTFVTSIQQEMAQYSHRYGRLPVDTVFFGGGTPNVLPTAQIHLIIDALHRYFLIDNAAEITMEMNPGVHTKAKLRTLKQHGINRVSIGVQSFHQSVLDDYGRNHRVSDTHRFITDVVDVGFTNVSCDILFGHPRHTLNDAKLSLQTLTEYPFKHVALYGLTIEKGTPFHRQNMVINNDQQADEYQMIQAQLATQGFKQYEVSNFSIPGFQSRHNIKYWEFQPTIGLGAGAHSYFMGHRYANRPDIHHYRDTEAQRWPKTHQNHVDWDEFMAVRLRYTAPILFDQLQQRFPKKNISLLKNALQPMNHHGLITLTDHGFNVAQRGLALVDEIVCHLQQP